MMKKTVSLYTLGCKLNQLESEGIAAAFKAAGFPVLPFDERAPTDILIVNTCTVTSKAEQKARRVIRVAARAGSLVIVTGCYAQMDAAELSAEPYALDGRVIVLPGDRKGELLDLPTKLAAFSDSSDVLRALSASAPAQEAIARFRYNPDSFTFHSRAFLKIQDGCDRRCSYCRVSLARGKSVSLDAPEVLERLRDLETRGYCEAVLTGVNLSQYSFKFEDMVRASQARIDLPSHFFDKDAGEKGNLGDLIELLLKNTSTIRLRLSSLEPEFVTEALCEAVRDKRVCPHFHLSVQSGSDAVLAKMRRPYTKRDVERAAALLRSAKDDPFLGCDIIAGFPGETTADFEETVSLCREVGFAWIHAFPYSPRPGTEAFLFTERVESKEIARRAAVLAQLAHEGKQAYTARQIGKTASAVIEKIEKNGKCSGAVHGVTENYLKVLIKTDQDAAPGSVALCRLTGVTDAALFASAGFDAEGELV